MPKKNDLTGRRFGRLTVIRATEQRGPDGGIIYECLCDCGNKCLVWGNKLTRKGHSAKRSCGCLHDETHQPHGGSKTRLYHKWKGMRERCFDSNSKRFPDYGGRGITVCEEWRSSFSAFREWALAHGYQEGLSIDRIDPNGHYCPENCRWITMAEQQKNKRNVRLVTIDGETHTLPEWAKLRGIKYGTIWKRLKDGWSIEHALEMEDCHG